MTSYSKVTEIFCLVDAFCKEYDEIVNLSFLGNPTKRSSIMSRSEVIILCILFQLSGFRTFKHIYIFYVQKHMNGNFRSTVSYSRFTELVGQNLRAMTLFLKTCCLGDSTGISFVDSAPIRVCKPKRIRSNKVFKGIATNGKSIMGWVQGFKLHIVINNKGEILNFTINQANVHDRIVLKKKSYLDKIYRKLYAKKGYTHKDLMQLIFADALHLITHIKNNIKNSLMTISPKIVLCKRSIIETANDELKNSCQIEHSRHRSFTNFLSNIVAALIAYRFLPKKPSINYQI